MRTFSFIVTLLLTQTLVSAGVVVPRLFQEAHSSRRDLSSDQVERELGSQLSSGSSIFGEQDPRYFNATTRYSTFAAPRFSIIVEPAQESDVPTIVQYCHDNSLEFLVQNRGHGTPKSLGSFDGIQINMANLRSIDLHPDGNTVWLGGGSYAHDVINFLWDRGLITTTGACECVGLMGPGLGGGHGRVEGYYGMVSDNIRQLNVVLSNGTSIRVNETSHSDLLWGMRGAGHNFGVVTSFEMNVFPRGPDTWHYHNYIWQGDRLDDVFNALNVLHGNGTTPVAMANNFGFFALNTSISSTEPIIYWSFVYRGGAEAAEIAMEPFNAIESVYDESGDIPYTQVATIQGSGLDSYHCLTHDNFHITSTAGLQTYNLTAEHRIYDGFVKRIAENYDLVKETTIIHEGYSTKAVTSKDPDDSAYPFREDHHLMLFDSVIPSNSSLNLQNAAWEWAREVVDAWNEGQPERLPSAYVNYANGFEPVEQWYGHEEWRLERLRDLKTKYDPANRFRFYNPIV